MKFTKKSIYIGLFSVLYLIVAFSSFWHACAFFGLANNSWMSIILAFAFEIGQAAVLFSLLTSKKDRSRVMPWVLMTMFTLVQVIGNVFSSYKYIILNSVENLRFFKEPIFIWTQLPDDQATVIIVYIVGAILPICALFLTSMITNYLTDEEEKKQALEEPKIEEQKIEGTDPDGGVIGEQGEDGLKVLQESLNSKDDEIEKLKEDHDKLVDEKFNVQEKFDNLLNDYDEQNKELGKLKKELEELKNNQQKELTDLEKQEIIQEINELNKEQHKVDEGEIFDLPKSELLKPHFIDQEKVPEKDLEEIPSVYDPDEVDKQKIEDLTGINKEQMEDLIKNGINEDKQESEKVSHFINQ